MNDPLNDPAADAPLGTDPPDREPICNEPKIEDLIVWQEVRLRKAWQLPDPPSGSIRILMFFAGIIFPAGFTATCLLVFPNQLGLRQDGQAITYMTLLLTGSAISVFLPLLFVSTLALGSYCIFPKSADFWLVRLGIYFGSILSIHFSILTTSVLYGFPLCAAIGSWVVFWPFAWLLMKIAVWLSTHFFRNRYSIAWIMASVLIISIPLAIISFLFSKNEMDWLFIIPLLLFIPFVGTPINCAVCYVLTTLYLQNQHQHTNVLPSLRHWIIGWAAIFTYYFVAWTISLHITVGIYEQLPF